MSDLSRFLLYRVLVYLLCSLVTVLKSVDYFFYSNDFSFFEAIGLTFVGYVLVFGGVEGCYCLGLRFFYWVKKA